VNGIDGPIIDKNNSQQALIAGVTLFIGKQESEIEGRQLIRFLV
jgi:hypothetical protein